MDIHRLKLCPNTLSVTTAVIEYTGIHVLNENVNTKNNEKTKQINKYYLQAYNYLLFLDFYKK